METRQLYYHSPCFDGVASAVLAWDFLEATLGWRSCELHPVNYTVRESWLQTELKSPTAVVDFLYHPQADFWADHHGSTFLTAEAREHFERSPRGLRFYDESARSCTGLLARELPESFERKPHHLELARWAEKIDSAEYESVEEALFSAKPALKINVGLALGEGERFTQLLIRALRESSLEQVAQHPEVRERFDRAQEAIRRGLNRFRAEASLTANGIVVFDVEDREDDVVISRYAPYYFFPDARYSAGIVRHADGVKITVMRNPWRRFASTSLGRICAALGGGGHHRVGAIQLGPERAGEVRSLLERVLAGIRDAEGRGTALATL